jgi:hypothetical protein
VRRRLAAAASLALAPVLAFGRAPETAPAPATFAIVGATIHPASGPDVPNGTVVVRDGKIVAVAAGAAAPAGIPVVEGKDRHVYPSLFPPLTALGLKEIGSVRATVDQSELGEINPDARASLAVNFDSELRSRARAACSSPGSPRPAASSRAPSPR